MVTIVKQSHIAPLEKGQDSRAKKHDLFKSYMSIFRMEGEGGGGGVCQDHLLCHMVLPAVFCKVVDTVNVEACSNNSSP